MEYKVVKQMADLRDFRIKIDLCFPPEMQTEAEQLQALAENLSAKAVNINETKGNEEKGIVCMERCGHRLGLPCTEISSKQVITAKEV